MKKLYFLILGGGKVKISYLLLAFLFATTTAATAEVIWSESFEKTAGQLTIGRAALCNDSTQWWSIAGWSATAETPTDPIQVTEGSLSYDGYSTGLGNKVTLNSLNGTADTRRFLDKKTGSVFVSAIINVASVGSTEDYFFGFNDGSSNYYGRVYAIADGAGFKLAVAKNTELKTSLTYTSVLNFNTNYLIVVEYKFVDGTKNDEVRLYVNPIKDTTTPTISHNAELSNQKSDASKIAGIFLRQRTTCPTVEFDEIRVATTWAELFPSATSEPDPDPEPDPEPTKPAISAPAKIEFGSTYYVLTGESYDITINIKGTDLEDDVTFASTCDQVTLSATSATKEQVMSAEGFELTLTLKATGATCDPKLRITSTNAPAVEVPIAWTVLPTIDVADLAELRAKAATVDLEALPAFRITNPVVVSYQDGDNYIYLQDDKGGIRMKDENGVLSATTLPTGTKIAAGLLGTVSNSFGYEFIPDRITTDGTAEVKAVTATLAEIDADKAAYADRLVRIEHVTFANSGQKFGTSQESFSQDAKDASLRLFSSVTDIAGQTIPARATVVGISTSTSKLLIAPRGWSDITVESSTVAIDKATIATNCYTQAGMLIVENATTDIAVYNLTGICVAKAAAMPYASFTLPQGIYAVKMNGQTCKVVVK